MSQVPRLITIPISHYCEKARWALDHTGIVYREDAHLQLFQAWPAWRAGGGDSVPVLVTRECVLSDSSAILQWADRRTSGQSGLYAGDAAALEDEFDEGLGVSARLWMYTHMLSQARTIIDYSRSHGVPRHELLAWQVAFPLGSVVMRWALGARPEARSRAHQSIQRSFDRVAARLADGREFLTADRFTAADLTFASLAASVLVPEEYGVSLPRLAELPHEMASQIREWRAHPAGQFALRMYRERRWARGSPLEALAQTRAQKPATASQNL